VPLQVHSSEHDTGAWGSLCSAQYAGEDQGIWSTTTQLRSLLLPPALQDAREEDAGHSRHAPQPQQAPRKCVKCVSSPPEVLCEEMSRNDELLQRMTAAIMWPQG